MREVVKQHGEARLPRKGIGGMDHGEAPNQEPRIDSDISPPVIRHMSSEPWHGLGVGCAWRFSRIS